MKMDRAQGAVPGGAAWAFVVFIMIVVFIAILENMVMDQAVDPLYNHATSMQWSSSQSTDGLRVFQDFRNAFTLIGLSIAALFFVGYMMYISRRNGGY